MLREPATATNTLPSEALSPRDPSLLALQKNIVQVWVLDDSLIDEASAAFARILSPDERQRAGAYRHARDRVRFSARRGALRSLLGRYLDRTPESLCFQRAPFGKPVLQPSDADGLAFNISQTDGMALLAFAWNCRVGVDVERIFDTMDLAGAGSQVFSPAENAALDAAWPDASATFFRIWTRKEALLKALGTGLAREPQLYTTRNDPQAGVGKWSASHMDAAMTDWTCRDLSTDQGSCAALAVSRKDARVCSNLFRL